MNFLALSQLLPGNGNADAEAYSHLIPGVGTEDIRSSFGLSTSIRSLTPISVDWTTGLNGADPSLSFSRWEGEERQAFEGRSGRVSFKLPVTIQTTRMHSPVSTAQRVSLAGRYLRKQGNTAHTQQGSKAHVITLENRRALHRKQ